jgi:hypothetical protein
MAEIMTVLVTVAMWIVGAMGVIGIPVLAIGLMASLSGGSTEVSGIKALADGVMPGQLVIGLVGLADLLPHAEEVGLLLGEDDRALLILEVLEEDFDFIGDGVVD